MQNHVMEREGERRSRAHHRSKVVRLVVSTTAYKQQKSQLYHCHMSEYDPLRTLSLHFQLTEGTESIKMAWFI